MNQWKKNAFSSVLIAFLLLEGSSSLHAREWEFKHELRAGTKKENLFYSPFWFLGASKASTVKRIEKCGKNNTSLGGEIRTYRGEKCSPPDIGKPQNENTGSDSSLESFFNTPNEGSSTSSDSSLESFFNTSNEGSSTSSDSSLESFFNTSNEGSSTSSGSSLESFFNTPNEGSSTSSGSSLESFFNTPNEGINTSNNGQDGLDSFFNEPLNTTPAPASQDESLDSLFEDIFGTSEGLNVNSDKHLTLTGKEMVKSLKHFSQKKTAIIVNNRKIDGIEGSGFYNDKIKKLVIQADSEFHIDSVKNDFVQNINNISYLLSSSIDTNNSAEVQNIFKHKLQQDVTKFKKRYKVLKKKDFIITRAFTEMGVF